MTKINYEKLARKDNSKWKPKENVTKMKSKFKSYCGTCHYTIWAGEEILYSGKGRHIDCLKALSDGSRRVMHPDWEKILGKVDKKKLLSAAKQP